MDYFEIISNFGFPVFCVIVLGIFIYQSYNQITKNNSEREDRLYCIIEENQRQMQELSNTNTKFVKVLETYKTDINIIKNDIDDIKESLELNKRKTDKKGE